MFSILSYVFGFLLIVANNAVAEKAMPFTQSENTAVLGWMLVFSCLAIHVFILGMGLQHIFGW